MKEYQIVCIDDDEQFLSSLAGALPRRVAPLCPQFRCSMDFVATPEELAAVVSEQEDEPPLAMVISDQLMPGTSGLKLIEQLKADRPDLVCILLTGHAGLQSAKHAINRHLLDQYVTKPVEDLAEFASLVANLLKRHHLDAEEKQRTAQLAAKVRELREVNGRVRAMHAAAEQVAMLSKGLKSLDFSEVVELVTREAPKILGGSWGVLCFPQQDCPATDASLVSRHECPLPEGRLTARRDAERACRNAQILWGDLPGACNELGGQPPGLVIPLTMEDVQHGDDQQRSRQQGFLCLCRLEGSTKASRELACYKAALLQEVLSANLTNANLYRQARQDSRTDPLTGADSRRVLEEELEAERHRAARHDLSFCIAIVDMDRFKRVNDESGHAAGDMMLRQLTEILRRQVRSEDTLARYGGDEFVVLMPETELDDALVVAERMRSRVEESLGLADPSATISCGVAQWSGLPQESGAEMLRRADTALYEAKRAGRNRVQTARAA